MRILLLIGLIISPITSIFAAEFMPKELKFLESSSGPFTVATISEIDLSLLKIEPNKGGCRTGNIKTYFRSDSNIPLTLTFSNTSYEAESLGGENWNVSMYLREGTECQNLKPYDIKSLHIKLKNTEEEAIRREIVIYIRDGTVSMYRGRHTSNRQLISEGIIKSYYEN